MPDEPIIQRLERRIQECQRIAHGEFIHHSNEGNEDILRAALAELKHHAAPPGADDE